MPAARLDQTKGHHHPPRWNAWTTRSAVAAVWAQDRRRRPRGEKFLVYELLFTLRRTQGAIGRYEGRTGAAVAAAGLLRRLGRSRRRIPGVGKGLTLVGGLDRIRPPLRSITPLPSPPAPPPNIIRRGTHLWSREPSNVRRGGGEKRSERRKPIHLLRLSPSFAAPLSE